MKTEAEIKKKLEEMEQSMDENLREERICISESAFCVALEWVVE